MTLDLAAMEDLCYCGGSLLIIILAISFLSIAVSCNIYVLRLGCFLVGCVYLSAQRRQIKALLGLSGRFLGPRRFHGVSAIRLRKTSGTSSNGDDDGSMLSDPVEDDHRYATRENEKLFCEFAGSERGGSLELEYPEAGTVDNELVANCHEDLMAGNMKYQVTNTEEGGISQRPDCVFPTVGPDSPHDNRPGIGYRGDDDNLMAPLGMLRNPKAEGETGKPEGTEDDDCMASVRKSIHDGLKPFHHRQHFYVNCEAGDGSHCVMNRLGCREYLVGGRPSNIRKVEAKSTEIGPPVRSLREGEPLKEQLVLCHCRCHCLISSWTSGDQKKELMQYFPILRHLEGVGSRESDFCNAIPV